MKVYSIEDNRLIIHGYFDWVVDGETDDEGNPLFYKSDSRNWTEWKFKDIIVRLPNTIGKNVINVIDKTYEEYGLPKIRRYGMDSMIYINTGDDKIKFFPTVGVIYNGVVSANIELLSEGYLLNDKVFIDNDIVMLLKKAGYECIASFDDNLQISNVLDIDFRNIRKFLELDLSDINNKISFIDLLKKERDVYNDNECFDEVLRIVLKHI